MCDEDFGYGDPEGMFDYDGDGELDHGERALYYDYLDRLDREDDDDEDEDDDDWNADKDDDFSGSYIGIMDDDLANDLLDEGIDPDDFELMSDYEKYKVLEASLLDEDDYEEYFDDYDFFDENWSDIEDLQNSGIDIENFLKLDDEDKYDLLTSHQLDPDDYCDLFDDDDYPWDRKEAEEEDDDDDEEREQLDVTKVVKREKRKVDLTELIENAYAKCDTFESIKGWVKSCKLGLRDQLRVDLMKFCMYLSSSDGNVDESEARFFSSQLGAALSVDNIRDFIKSQRIDSAEFVKTPPQTIVEIVNNKDVLESIGAKIKYALQVIISVFETVGFEMIACDGTVDPKEREDLKGYIQMMYEYAAVAKPVEKPIQDRIDLGDNVYEEGVYKVGVDIPPGLYKLFAYSDDSAFSSIHWDANGDEIVENNHFENQAYVYVNEAHFLEIRRCVAVPIDDAVMYEGDEYPSGEYYVGRELPPGEYRIYADSKEYSGFLSIVRLMADGKRKIVTNNIVSNTAYVDVENDQVLCLRHCTLKWLPTIG